MPAETRTVDAGQFAALRNLFCFVYCGDGEEPRVALTAEQAGDILLYGAHRFVCDDSRLMACAVLAFLGIRSGIPEADELIAEVHAAMRNGKGSLSDEDDEP